MKIKPSELYIIKRRNEIVWQLDHEGYTGGDISTMLNKLDVSWICRILKLRPKNWTPDLIQNHKTVA